MAKNKKAQPVTMSKTKLEQNKICIKPNKVAIGHQSHLTGTGVHLDKRTKRNRTRSDKQRQAISEWIN